MNDKIINVITLLRGTTLCEEYPNDTAENITTEIYTQGNCGNFAKALSLMFDGSCCLVNDLSHVVSSINNRLYDITGDVTDTYTVKCIISDDELIDYIDNYSFEERGPIL